MPARSTSSRYPVWIWYSVSREVLVGLYSPFAVRVVALVRWGPAGSRCRGGQRAEAYAVAVLVHQFGRTVRGNEAGKLGSPVLPMAFISSRMTVLCCAALAGRAWLLAGRDGPV